MFVKDIMKKPKVIEEDITLDKAAEIISAHKISSLVIMKKDKIIGLLTEEDIIKNFGRDIHIFKIMRKKIVIVSPGDSTEKAIELIKDHKQEVLPVVDKGHLVGVISATDLLINACETEHFLFG